MQGNSVLSPSPSFNSFSSGKLHGIATRVVDELRHEHDSVADHHHIFACAPKNPPLQSQEYSNSGPLQQQQQKQEQGGDSKKGEGQDDFEFAFVCREPYLSPTSADEIFCNGRIRPLHPISTIFDQSLVGNNSPTKSTDSSKKSRHRRPPLRKLMTEEREREAAHEPASCTSSEAYELDGVPTGTYCAWTPKMVQAEAEESAAPSSHVGCKKSNSIGPSKRWKLRDLLYRSNSDGNETFVVLTPPGKKTIADASPASENGNKGKVRRDAADYARNRTVKEAGDKRRSSFLVGFFANVDGLSLRLQFAATER